MTDSLPAFSQQCRDHATDVWGASYDHPFVRALVDGSLDPERFKFYQMQDARYLEAIADAFYTSTRYEWMFWEQAWTQQAWPV